MQMVLSYTLHFHRFYDTSKQAIGALIIHFANVYLSTLFKGDPCTWCVTFPVKHSLA